MSCAAQPCAGRRATKSISAERPLWSVPEKAHYEKFDQPASRFALTAVFVAKYADGVRVAVTGASEGGVFRWREAEAALSADFSAEALSGLSLSGAGMISDLHGSGAYRAHLAKVLTGRAVAPGG